jgi:hypothetical protein
VLSARGRAVLEAQSGSGAAVASDLAAD